MSEYTASGRAFLGVGFLVLVGFPSTYTMNTPHYSFPLTHTHSLSHTHTPTRTHTHTQVSVNAEPVDALSFILHKDNAYFVGKELCNKLKEIIPRQQFKVL